MTIQIAIIGLGQTGTSVGLALAEHKERLHRIGHDININQARQAEKLGAVDGIKLNLPAAVENANMIVLALPVDQIRETIQIIAPILSQGAVVMDLAPVKQVVMEWACQALPANRYYVGLAPVRNPLYLNAPESEAAAGHADLFQRGVVAIVTPPGIAPEAISLATDFVDLLGAEHLFIDQTELDGLVTATHILPALLSAALVNATVQQPGWLEGRKFADRAYASVSQPAGHSSAAALTSMVLNSPENTLRVLDHALLGLRSMRALIEKGDAQALQDYFEQARRSREEWWHERGAGNWNEAQHLPTEMPTSREAFRWFFGMGKQKEKQSKK